MPGVSVFQTPMQAKPAVAGLLSLFRFFKFLLTIFDFLQQFIIVVSKNAFIRTLLQRSSAFRSDFAPLRCEYPVGAVGAK